MQGSNLATSQTSVADPGPFDTDPDPAFQFDMDPDPTVLYGSGSLPFQTDNVSKMVRYFLYTSSVDFPCQ
jgi:hypothetical protein